MTEKQRLQGIKACFKTLTHKMVDDIVVLARAERQKSSVRQSKARAAVGTYIQRWPHPTAKSYIESLPRRTQHELLAWMLFGREPYAFSVQDVAAVCSPKLKNSLDIAGYLTSKYQLPDYLERAMQFIDL